MAPELQLEWLRAWLRDERSLMHAQERQSAYTAARLETLWDVQLLLERLQKGDR